MKRRPLTISRIDKLSCPEGKAQTFLWDSDVPGLAVRCTPTRKTFVFQAELHGNTLRVTIGEYPAWRLDASADSAEPNARRRARELRGMVDQGIDPREKEKQAKAESERQQQEGRRKAALVSDAWADYMEYLRTTNSPKTRKPRSARYILDHERLSAAGGDIKKRGKGETIAGPLFPLLAKRLVDLTSVVVAEWLQRESASRPTVAAHAYRLLRAFLVWLNQSDYRGLVDTGVCTSHEVRGQLARPNAKDDCLQREQLASWFAEVRKLGEPVVSVYLQALLLTGARREELAGLRWEDVDFKWSSLRISDKIEGERTIPLPPYVSALLAALPRRNEWVFSSVRSESGRIQEPRMAHNRALAAAGLPHLSLHGLRRSFGTLAEWVECPVGIVAQVMGHKPSATAEKHYRSRPLDLLRLWHVRIEGWMLGQAGIEQPSVVSR